MSHTRTATTLARAALATLALSSITAAQGPLRSANPFAVLGGSTVTNTGPTTISGNLGVSPGTAITGLGSITLNGTVHAADGVAALAQQDARTAYNYFRSLAFTTDLSGINLGGHILTPGVYAFSSSAQLTGNLVLDFLGNPNAQFVFQIGSAFTSASGSSVSVLNGGAGSGVYWQVGSSATLGTTSSFMGNLIADQSITMTTGATIGCGRAIALIGAVTLDHNVITADCRAVGAPGGPDDFGSGGFSGGVGGVTPPAVVPEPSTFVLLGSGLFGLLVVRRRRTR